MCGVIACHNIFFHAICHPCVLVILLRRYLYATLPATNYASLLFGLLRLNLQGPEKRVLSSDAKTIKIWSRNDGQVLTNVETPADINDLCIAHDSRYAPMDSRL